MERTITDEVSAISKLLTEKLGRNKYRIWFENSTKLEIREGYLKIGVPNPFIANWIENHFSGQIKQAVQEVTGSELKITFAIDSQLLGQNRCGQLNTQLQYKEKPGEQRPYRPAGNRTTVAEKFKHDLDNFVVGSSNELAYNAAKAVVREDKSPFNPLFIHGGYGLGKTHLLQGICKAVCERRPEAGWLYLSAEDFVNQFVLALKTKKLEAFRHRMRQTDLLAIDDIHFLASKPSTQEEFLHTFNKIDLAGKQVILACDAHPKMIGQLSEKLVNRFVSGMVVKIEAPDFKMRCEICRQHAARVKKNIPENVIHYIAENLKSNVRELQGAILKLVAFSSLQNQQITLSLTEEVLAEHLARTDPIVHISDIESAVAAFFGITSADIHSPKKDRTISLARHFSMYLARKHTKMSSSEIGRVMGNKNHATVLLACRNIEELLERNAEIHWQGPMGTKLSKAKTALNQLQQAISG